MELYIVNVSYRYCIIWHTFTFFLWVLIWFVIIIVGTRCKTSLDVLGFSMIYFVCFFFEKYHSYSIRLSSRSTIQFKSLSSIGRMQFDVILKVDRIIFFPNFHALGDGLGWVGHLYLYFGCSFFYPVIRYILNIYYPVQLCHLDGILISIFDINLFLLVKFLRGLFEVFPPLCIYHFSFGLWCWRSIWWIL